MKEIWKDIPNYEGLYQISNFGRIKSLPRLKPAPNGCFYMSKEKILKGSIINNGNQNVRTIKFTDFKDKNGKWHYKYYKINRLVAQGFMNFDINSDLNIYHIDGNTLNDNITNLAIGTEKEKTRNAIKNGLFEVREKRRKETLNNYSENEKYKRKLIKRLKSLEKEIKNTKNKNTGIRKRNNYEIYINKNNKYVYLGSEKTLQKAIKKRIYELKKYKIQIKKILEEENKNGK